ncbi:hypothetical protein LINPERHAP1_LOCUS13604 [Linum perenne]
MLSRRCAQSPICPLCNIQEETIIHCLFLCPHAASTWNRASTSFLIPHPNTQFAEWLFNFQEHCGKGAAEKATALCWNIWKARNAFFFRNIVPNVATTLEHSINDASTWSINITGNPTTILNHIPSVRHLVPPRPHSSPPPHTLDLRVYCDGSFLDGPQKAAYGVIIMNIMGQVCDGRAGRFICSSAIVSEAKALLAGVTFASNSANPCTVYSDCLNLVNSLNGPKNRWPWECYGLLGRISKLVNGSPNILVDFVPRKSNLLADWVARRARDNLLPSPLRIALYSEGVSHHSWMRRPCFVTVLEINGYPPFKKKKKTFSCNFLSFSRIFF